MASEQTQAAGYAAGAAGHRAIASADPAILGSAIVVGGVWLYRKLIEPVASVPATGSLKGLVGLEAAPAATAQFVPAFAFVYIVLAVVGMGAPSIARSAAITIALGDILSNGVAVSSDISGQTTGKTVSTGSETSSSSSAKTSASSSQVGPVNTSSPATLFTGNGRSKIVHIEPS
jgi:hypothetical protein